MPPIPQSLDQELLDIIASINRRKKDLLDFQIPRLRVCKGPLSAQQQYVAEIREDTEILTRQIEVCVFDLIG
jgi:protein transport protein SEC20